MAGQLNVGALVILDALALCPFVLPQLWVPPVPLKVPAHGKANSVPWYREVLIAVACEALPNHCAPRFEPLTSLIKKWERDPDFPFVDDEADEDASTLSDALDRVVLSDEQKEGIDAPSCRAEEAEAEK